MKRKWIIPLALCLLLLIAWFFRWERGPTQTDKSLKIIHSKDRWTGQAWITVYGKGDGRLYSGNEFPVLSPNEVEYRKSQILSSPGEAQKKQELEKGLVEAENIMKEHEWGSAKYLEYADILYQKENPSRFLIGLPSLFGNSRYAKYEYGIPQNFINDHLIWLDAMHVKWESNAKLTEQIRQAETQTESELKTWVRQLRTITTVVWAVLLGVATVSTVILYRREAG